MMNPFKYLLNVVTGKYTHWNATNNAMVSEIWKHWDKVEEDAVPYLKQFVTSALNMLDNLIGPHSISNISKETINVRSLNQEDFYKAYLLLLWYFTLLLPTTHAKAKVSCRRGIVALFGNRDNFEKLLQLDLDKNDISTSLSNKAAGYLLTILQHKTNGMTSDPIFTYSFTMLGLANYRALMKDILISTDKADNSGGSEEIDFKRAMVDELVFTLDYRCQYAPVLLEYLSEAAIAELFLFRAWTTQFGYRMFSTNSEVSEHLIGETVNSCKYLGLESFEKIHGFSIEQKLGDDFISLIEDRWRDYDLEVSTDVRRQGIPKDQIIAILSKKLKVDRSDVIDGLKTEFLAQLDAIKRRALQLGILVVSKKT